MKQYFESYIFSIPGAFNKGANSTLGWADGFKIYKDLEKVKASIPTVTSSWTVNIVPVGAIDGVNTSFDFADTFVAGTLCLYYNGSRLVNGTDFTEGGSLNSCTMSFAPLAGTTLIADYEKA